MAAFFTFIYNFTYQKKQLYLCVLFVPDASVSCAVDLKSGLEVWPVSCTRIRLVHTLPGSVCSVCSCSLYPILCFPTPHTLLHPSPFLPSLLPPSPFPPPSSPLLPRCPQPNEHREIITHLARLVDDISVPMARASILWLIGEYSDRIPDIAPDVLRKMAKAFIDEVTPTNIWNLFFSEKKFLR